MVNIRFTTTYYYAIFSNFIHPYLDDFLIFKSFRTFIKSSLFLLLSKIDLNENGLSLRWLSKSSFIAHITPNFSHQKLIVLSFLSKVISLQLLKVNFKSSIFVGFSNNSEKGLFFSASAADFSASSNAFLSAFILSSKAFLSASLC